jgi:hypothetical protein
MNFADIHLRGGNNMDKSNVLADLGLLSETVIGLDLFNPVHIRYTVTLDHDLDGELLKKAWDKIKRVYPIVDAVYELEHGDKDFYINMDPVTREKYKMDHLYLVKAQSGVNDPIRSKVPIEPFTEACGERFICISYYERTVTVSAYHTLVDGGGLKMIFTAFLYVYLAMYTGHEDENPIVDLTEGRNSDEYYKGLTLEDVFSQEYTPVPLYSLPLYCTGFIDKDMVRDEDGNVYAGGISVSVDELIRLCKENGTNPSSMMCTLLAKAAYALNPDVKEDIVFDITLSERKLFGFEKSIANAVGLATTYVTADDIMNKSIAEVSGRIRKDVDKQRTKDYFITYRRLFATYEKNPAFKSRTVTYIGAFDVGDNNNHIVDFDMGTNSIYNLFMMQVNDKFLLNVYYGLATEKYVNELINIFSELGIKAELIHPVHRVVRDSKTPVL